jgi:hypothetical protein
MSGGFVPVRLALLCLCSTRPYSHRYGTLIWSGALSLEAGPRASPWTTPGRWPRLLADGSATAKGSDTQRKSSSRNAFFWRGLARLPSFSGGSGGASDRLEYSTERTETLCGLAARRQQEIVVRSESNPKSCVQSVKHEENGGENGVSIEPDRRLGKGFSAPVGLGFDA